DRRDDALVAVPARHLVAGLHAALHGEVDLHHLEDARGEVVARGDLHLLLLEAALEVLAQILETALRLLELLVRVLRAEPDLEPFLTRHLAAVGIGDLRARYV